MRRESTNRVRALLSEGGRLDDPARFVKTLNEMFLTMAQGHTPAGAAGARSQQGGDAVEEEHRDQTD